jgi:Ca2+-binding RTX toxin-like protein
MVVTNIGETRFDRAHALAIHPRDGRVVVAGSSTANIGSPTDFALARYHAHTCGGLVVTQINARSNTTVMGTAGNDVIFDFGHDNRIYGLEGNDHLCSLRGTNVLSGGSGNDYLRGGSGTDTLDGGTGTDRCDGGAGRGDTATACETVTNVP